MSDSNMSVVKNAEFGLAFVHALVVIEDGKLLYNGQKSTVLQVNIKLKIPYIDDMIVHDLVNYITKKKK